MSEQPNNGGPAFPNPALADENFHPSYDMSGMSLRDWFAGQVDVSDAMPLLNLQDCEAMIGRERPSEFVGLLEWHFDVIARMRLMAADAMIRARGQA